MAAPAGRKGWQVIRSNLSRRRVYHVLPENDLRMHVFVACWCRPVRRHEDGGVVVVHNSHDGRELVERHGLQ